VAYIRVERITFRVQHLGIAHAPDDPMEANNTTESSAPWSDEAGLPIAQQIVAAAIGAACLAVGAIATFLSSNGAGSATLIGVGLGLLVLAFLGNRLELLKLGGFEVRVRAAEHLYGRAHDLDLRGLSDVADKFRAQADDLLLGQRRTARLNETVHKAEDYSRQYHPSAADVRALFRKGEETDRTIALVLMREDPTVADFDAILDGITSSRSAFEQYQALAAAERLLPDLDPESRGLLRKALLEQTGPGGWIKPDEDRSPAAQRMLAALQESGAS
jgi:hypothetical protein